MRVNVEITTSQNICFRHFKKRPVIKNVPDQTVAE